MDTPTRERIEALEARVKELEAEVKLLRKMAGAVSNGPTWADIKKNNPLFGEGDPSKEDSVEHGKDVVGP